ncbi:MAG: adenylyltransferase/cytidyltransferase family protein [Parcubacteria group bacterium]|nr:adenylyltransferase/cytidyltransferase family protein [Parcubacteria group bacterium]
MRKVMVFGTFDGLHEGHKHFLREARKEGDYLVVVLPLDRIVEELKGHPPHHTLSERISHLEQYDGVDEVVVGDEEISAWEVVKKHKPNAIAVGYDQNALKEDLGAHLGQFDWPIEIRVMSPYEPEQLHSSLLNR